MSHGPVIHFFAGKGGAGKSTLATAYAMNLLEANGKERVLLLSLETPGGVADLREHDDHDFWCTHTSN